MYDIKDANTRNMIKHSSDLCFISCDDEDFGELTKLVARSCSMYRCLDSMVLKLESEQDESYCILDKDCQAIFLSEESLAELSEKYAVPPKINLTISILNKLLASYQKILEQEAQVRKEINLIKQSNLDSEDFDEDEYNRYLDCSKWIKKNKDKIIQIQSAFDLMWG